MSESHKIGVFGGSFNPVHNGHLAIARASLDKFGLEKVIFIPAALPPHKPAGRLAPESHRLAMLRLALAGAPRFEVSEVELERGGKSYTIDTVRGLIEIGGGDQNLYLIIGADNLLEIAAWKEVEELTRLCRFIVVTRPGFDLKKLDDENKAWVDLILEEDSSNLLELSLPVSSSGVREAAREGERLEEMVPAGVADYIRENGLYRKIFPEEKF